MLGRGEPVSTLFVLVSCVIYFLPVLVAAARRCKAGAGILILNLFLGWTLLGWVAALIWAAVGEVTEDA